MHSFIYLGFYFKDMCMGNRTTVGEDNNLQITLVA